MPQLPEFQWKAVLLASSLVTLLFFSWAFWRASNSVLVKDRSWPRAFPYPDRALIALERYYDRLYPVEPGYIKSHGEVFRVRWTIYCAMLTAFGGWLVAAGLYWREARHASQDRRRRIRRLLAITDIPAATMVLLPPGLVVSFGTWSLLIAAEVVAIAVGPSVARAYRRYQDCGSLLDRKSPKTQD